MDLHSIKQSDLNEYLTDTENFWLICHNAVNSSQIKIWEQLKGSSFENFVVSVWKSSENRKYLNTLFDYPVLKKEFLVSYYEGFILTNFRLIIATTTYGLLSIPLGNISNYNLNNDGVLEFNLFGKSFKLEFSEILSTSIVNSAILRYNDYNINETQALFLSKSIQEIKNASPELKFTKIENYPSTQNQDEILLKKNKLVRTLAIITLGILIIILSYVPYDMLCVDNICTEYAFWWNLPSDSQSYMGVNTIQHATVCSILFALYVTGFLNLHKYINK